VVHLSNDATQKPIRQVKWIPPLDNIIKVNVDGSSLSNPGRSGFGGLIKNNNGDWLLGLSGFCGITSCMAAELYVIFHCLRIAYDAGHRNIILESDSRMALDLIMSDVQSHHHHHGPLISQLSNCNIEIGLFIFSIPSVKVTSVQIDLLSMVLLTNLHIYYCRGFTHLKLTNNRWNKKPQMI